MSQSEAVISSQIWDNSWFFVTNSAEAGPYKANKIAG